MVHFVANILSIERQQQQQQNWHVQKYTFDFVTHTHTHTRTNRSNKVIYLYIIICFLYYKYAELYKLDIYFTVVERREKRDERKDIFRPFKMATLNGKLALLQCEIL